MDLTRRDFMVGCSAAIAAMAGSRVLGMGFGEWGGSTSDQILVVVFLRGGIDGLHLLGPADDKDYVAARPPQLRVGTAGDHAGIPLGNAYPGFDFRLHKSAAPLKELYDAKQLAIVHACGLTNATRSHFEAMDLMERGVAEMGRNAADGWVTRLVGELKPDGAIPVLASSDRVPDMMLGCEKALATPSPESLNLFGGKPIEGLLRKLYTGQSTVDEAGRRTLQALDAVGGKLRKPDGSWIPYEPSNGAKYPDGELGNTLKSVARMIRGDLGLKVAAVDFGGWDTHEYQEGRFAALVDHLSKSLAAFYNDLSAYHAKLNVVVVSEFGRRLRANQSWGTDHGHGNLMMVLGGGVLGGKVYGRWPGLANEQLDQGADLAITTDYRTVLAELVGKRLGLASTDRLLPNYKPQPALGLYQPV